MIAYAVTATNKYFWQKLAVAARNPESATRKFARFLRSRDSLANEKYEWSEGNKLSPDERCDRADYVYRFDDDKIALHDREASVIVQMIDSGGIG